MRNPITLAATAVLLFGMTAAAQIPSGDPRTRNQIFERLAGDLTVANTAATPATGDRTRIRRAMDELNALRFKMDSGDYDRHQFNEAVRSVQEVVNQNKTLSEFTFKSLNDDLSRLRIFEARSPGLK
jgi:hypothetical protein